MSNPAAFQYPPPKNWQDFELLCRDLWEKLWNDPNTQKNGRSGQAQYGVDVYGRPDQNETLAGVQCKGKDNNLGSSLTPAELEAEVNNAKKFSPALSNWILATTGPRDSQIQQSARELTAEQLKTGMFSVSVWAWDDIVERLLNYPALIVKWLPQIGTVDPATSLGFSIIAALLSIFLSPGLSIRLTGIHHFREWNAAHPLCILVERCAERRKTLIGYTAYPAAGPDYFPILNGVPLVVLGTTA